MIDKRHFDVWIVETNTVYRKVPYSVVTDWLQQGRLLGEDQLRYTGTEKWVLISTVPALSAFLPRAEPQANDRAEALEPVEVEFQWKRSTDESDEDVDMIPLIDVSLVLLVFFMMTAVVAAASSIDVPQAKFKTISVEPEMWWIGIDQNESFSLGQGESGKGEFYPTRDQLIAGFAAKLQESRAAKVRIRAHRDLPYSKVRDLIGELSKFRQSGQLQSVMAEVSEPSNQ